MPPHHTGPRVMGTSCPQDPQDSHSSRWSGTSENMKSTRSVRLAPSRTPRPSRPPHSPTRRRVTRPLAASGTAHSPRVGQPTRRRAGTRVPARPPHSPIAREPHAHSPTRVQERRPRTGKLGRPDHARAEPPNMQEHTPNQARADIYKYTHIYIPGEIAGDGHQNALQACITT
jgi:hypothetical protein